MMAIIVRKLLLPQGSDVLTLAKQIGPFIMFMPSHHQHGLSSAEHHHVIGCPLFIVDHEERIRASVTQRANRRINISHSFIAFIELRVSSPFGLLAEQGQRNRNRNRSRIVYLSLLWVFFQFSPLQFVLRLLCPGVGGIGWTMMGWSSLSRIQMGKGIILLLAQSIGKSTLGKAISSNK